MSHPNTLSPPDVQLSTAELADACKGIAWWNNLHIGERRYWLLVTKGGSVAECWEAYKDSPCPVCLARRSMSCKLCRGEE